MNFDKSYNKWYNMEKIMITGLKYDINTQIKGEKF